MIRRRQRQNSYYSSISNSADAVVAATAGEDSWRTWAGRTSGGPEMEWWDLVRGSKRSVQRLLLYSKYSTPPAGTTCPVCFMEPETWHITESCSHAVCLDCLQAYAASQVQDPSHTGALKCPVCPQWLRKKDALRALQDNPTLIQQWDEKIRNQLLRALPSYRPCPKCSSKKPENDNSSGTRDTAPITTTTGGGFVTPSCLATKYQERRDEASQWLLYGAHYGTFLYLAICCWFVPWHISYHPSTSPMTDIFAALFPIATIKVNIRYVRQLAAIQARKALFRAIPVECPCCNDTFVLPASSTQSGILDAESKQWMDRNTRPCPSCSVPISKQGGCNHMSCPNCRASFCWACMRLRTQCRAYQCQHGAKFGNAIPGLGEVAANRTSPDSLMNQIDSILNSSPQEDGNVPFPVGPNVLILLAWIGRSSSFFQKIVEGFMVILATVFATGISAWAVAVFVLWNVYQTWMVSPTRRFHTATALADPGPSRQTVSEALLGIFEENQQVLEERRLRREQQEQGRRQSNPHMFVTEEDMIREAMRRSLLEQ